MNRTFEHVYKTTVIATEAIAVNKLVGYDGAVADAGDACLGPAYEKAANGNPCTVVNYGKAVCIAGAAIAAGAAVAADAQGRVVAHAGGAVIVGRALEAAAAADDEVLVLVFPN